jgi:intracellular multiplication protein IcmV
MAIRDVFKVSRKTFFNPTEWLGYRQLKTNTNIIWDTIKGLFVVSKPERIETFAAAISRLELTEADLSATAKRFLAYSIFFVILGGITLAVSFVMLYDYGFFAWLICTLVTVLFLVQAFRFHFWYFQIVQRKLGCTFQEWWQGKINPPESKL